jgi:hypothetical protein
MVLFYFAVELWIKVQHHKKNLFAISNHLSQLTYLFISAIQNSIYNNLKKNY